MRRAFAISVLVVVILFAQLAQAKTVALVVNKENKTDDIKTANLVNILKGKTITWAGGKPIVIVMRDESSQDMEFIFRRTLHMTSEQVRAFIQANPKLIVVAKSDEQLLRLVSTIHGSIGFVNLYSVTNKDVKVVKIDGRLPFDVDYPLKGSD